MTHAERICEAERAVVEAAVYYANVCREWKKSSGPGLRRVSSVKVSEAAHKLIALRAATCPECGGTGEGLRSRIRGEEEFTVSPCPAGCEAGRRRGA